MKSSKYYFKLILSHCDSDVIRKHNFLIWSKTHYHCATKSYINEKNFKNIFIFKLYFSLSATSSVIELMIISILPLDYMDRAMK